MGGGGLWCYVVFLVIFSFSTASEPAMTAEELEEFMRSYYEDEIRYVSSPELKKIDKEQDVYLQKAMADMGGAEIFGLTDPTLEDLGRDYLASTHGMHATDVDTTADKVTVTSNFADEGYGSRRAIGTRESSTRETSRELEMTNEREKKTMGEKVQRKMGESGEFNQIEFEKMMGNEMVRKEEQRMEENLPKLERSGRDRVWGQHNETDEDEEAPAISYADRPEALYPQEAVERFRAAREQYSQERDVSRVECFKTERRLHTDFWLHSTNETYVDIREHLLDKVVLITNSASNCGFTIPHLSALV